MGFHKLESDPRRREQAVLEFWEREKAFERSLKRREEGPHYVFYEGPPTANGRPHFGHLLPRIYKDLFPRYKTMRGYFVGRKAGWDCHGLPVELEVEKELGIKTKAEIERYGIEKFVERCKASVHKYIRAWEDMIRRMGFWIDLARPYITYKDEYIETLWWELKRIHEQGLLYQGHKILPYCPRCGTPLSSHEVAQGYRNVEDPSVFVLMPLVDDPEKAFLVWTTTPWTLPANVALAVDPDATYVEVAYDGKRLILAKPRLPAVLGEKAEVVAEYRGKDLIGLHYQPLYPLADPERGYLVVGAEFVTMDEGTGIVHIAPAFGEEDYQLGKDEGLPFVQPVDRIGKFTQEFPLAAGKFVKEADPLIIEDLKGKGRLLKAEKYAHDYPFCWRCDTPLLYYALDSWFIASTKKKDEITAENERVSWYPEYVGRGRFGDFLRSMRDWALSRDRYWGTPLPVWVCGDCGAIRVIGSREELVEHARDPELARTVELHRPYVDRVELSCQCEGTMRRVPYVLDTWFDSGSMHTAQWHYPFENQEQFEKSYPADFICEALDQTRGWFYTLLVTGVLVHGKTPYRNVLVTGMGLDAQGQKMSKSRGNVLDPLPIADQHGADAVRWYLISESAPWTLRRIDPQGVAKARFGFLETVRNSHDFFALYARIDGFDPKEHSAPDARPALDRWLLSRVAAAVEEVTAALDRYDVVGACTELTRLVDDLSNWYIRLSRPRFWGQGFTPDKLSAYRTLYEALRTLALLLAPFTPFLAEAMWSSLRGEEDPQSVHWADWPQGGPRDEPLERAMRRVREVASLGLAARNLAKIKVRQPLAALYVVKKPGDEEVPEELWDLARTELNVREISPVEDLARFQVPKLSPNFKVLGPRLGPLAQRAAAAISSADQKALWEELSRSGKASLNLDGEEVGITPEDVNVSWEPAEGFVVLSEPEGEVALDVRLTDELRAEGDFRELVHRIQLARKEAGFEVTDRIELFYQGEIAGIFEKFGERIREEVLAVALKQGELSDPEHTLELEVHGRRGVVQLRRSNR
ncbi:isoleucine--tRNA ligase [Candidatus Bipolaricaulota bacterium]|nr:isoleucine--tRNA ligase [Candidatus Bipolaricaulota bacterium]